MTNNIDNEETLKESFDKEFQEIKANTILTPEYRKKKLVVWFIRTTIAIVLATIFWEYNWVKWVFYFYIPLSIISLIIIFGGKYILEKKISKTNSKIKSFEDKLE